MNTNRIPKQALQYKPKGQRNIGRRGRDGGINFILRIKEQESNLIFPEHDDDDDDDNEKIMEGGICPLAPIKLQLLSRTFRRKVPSPTSGL
jgi:hypothetical protein